MATNNQVLQEKKPLQPIIVRTMKKDIAKLKELDSLEEKSHGSNLPSKNVIAKAPVLPKITLPDITVPVKKPAPIQTKNTKEETPLTMSESLSEYERPKTPEKDFIEKTAPIQKVIAAEDREKHIPTPTAQKNISNNDSLAHEYRAPSLEKTDSNQQKEKEFLKNMPLPAKETLATSTKIEQTQRRKFMEDVEDWIASQNKNLKEV